MKSRIKWLELLLDILTGIYIAFILFASMMYWHSSTQGFVYAGF